VLVAGLLGGWVGPVSLNYATRSKVQSGVTLSAAATHCRWMSPSSPPTPQALSTRARGAKHQTCPVHQGGWSLHQTPWLLRYVQYNMSYLGYFVQSVCGSWRAPCSPCLPLSVSASAWSLPCLAAAAARRSLVVCSRPAINRAARAFSSTLQAAIPAPVPAANAEPQAPRRLRLPPDPGLLTKPKSLEPSCGLMCRLLKTQFAALV
jgi:hypothetical protein